MEIFILLQRTLKNLSIGENLAKIIYDFEIELLTLLGFYKSGNPALAVNTQGIIENILERKLKTRQFLPQFTS